MKEYLNLVLKLSSCLITACSRKIKFHLLYCAEHHQYFTLCKWYILLLQPFAYFCLLLLAGLIWSFVCFPLWTVPFNEIWVLNGILDFMHELYTSFKITGRSSSSGLMMLQGSLEVTAQLAFWRDTREISSRNAWKWCQISNLSLQIFFLQLLFLFKWCSLQPVKVLMAASNYFF